MTAIGSFCTGYGGLDLAVEAALGPVEHVWHAEIDPDASKVLAVRFPGTPNLGDVRVVDWSTAEAVDILTAGFPCQPVSSAGRRKGVDDERWLWDDIASAVGRMDPRPRMLVLENVAGLLSANRGDALARVVQGLAALGYVGRYRLLRASDVGAAHRRERWFCVAHLADASRSGLRADVDDLRARQPDAVRRLPPTPTARDHKGHNQRGDDTSLTGALLPTPNSAQGRGTGTPSRETAARRMHQEGRRFLDDAVALLPTPRATDGTKGGPNQRGSSGDLMLPSAVVQLLPTPSAGNFNDGEDLETWQARRAEAAERHGNNGFGMPLGVAARLLPSPPVTDAKGGRNATAGRSPDAGAFNDGWTLSDVAHAARWGEYGAAIARWERVTGRPAPDPTETGTKGQQRLAPAFVEWMMGLPAGWVTDLIGRNAALRALGNGVVWQQAAAAIRELAA